MKRILLILLCLSLACTAGRAQGLKFETGTWEEVLAKAKAQNKIVFVDVFTQWCGPCKHVAATVFPQERLGSYFNPLFLNFQIDAESPAGVEFVKTYPVKGYPTFLFIDGEGKLIHKVLGAKDVDEFIAEAKMISMYERHGGVEQMARAIEEGTAGKELLYDYYKSANEENRPAALNLYLKTLTKAERMDENNKLIEELSLYDKDLYTLLADEIVETSRNGMYDNGNYPKEFVFNIAFPVQYDISTYLSRSIRSGNKAWFEELLALKARFADFAGRHHEGSPLLDGDLRVTEGRGLFFATDEYNRLCFWTVNREDDALFLEALPKYMERLMADYPAGTLVPEDNPILQMAKARGLNGQMLQFSSPVLGQGTLTARNIVAWTDWYWKLSPSDKKTRALCRSWAEYAYLMNPYNYRSAVPAADLLARMGCPKEAKALLEKAIATLKDLRFEGPKVYKDLELKLRDVENGKL